MYLENMEAHNYNQFIIEQKIFIFLIFFFNVSLFFSFSSLFCHLKETQQLFPITIFYAFFFGLSMCFAL